MGKLLKLFKCYLTINIVNSVSSSRKQREFEIRNISQILIHQNRTSILFYVTMSFSSLLAGGRNLGQINR